MAQQAWRLVLLEECLLGNVTVVALAATAAQKVQMHLLEETMVLNVRGNNTIQKRRPLR